MLRQALPVPAQGAGTGRVEAQFRAIGIEYLRFAGERRPYFEVTIGLES